MVAFGWQESGKLLLHFPNKFDELCLESVAEEFTKGQMVEKADR